MTANRAKQKDTQGKVLKGIDKTRLYGIWCKMHRRCYEPNSKDYPNYGERGITICPEWHHDNVNGFYNFRAWATQNGYSDTLSIDRIDPNGDYTPNNCRWATKNQQDRNRRSNIPVIVDGVEYGTIIEACEAYGRTEDYDTICNRITRYGWTGDRAFTEPIGDGHSTPVTYDGIEYKSVSEACKALNLNQGTVMSYKHRHNNTTYEEAIHHYMKETEA